MQVRPNGNKWNIELETKGSTDVISKAYRAGLGFSSHIQESWWLNAEVGRELGRELQYLKCSNEFRFFKKREVSLIGFY